MDVLFVASTKAKKSARERASHYIVSRKIEARKLLYATSRACKYESAKQGQSTSHSFSGISLQKL